jgi:hypothetical protein
MPEVLDRLAEVESASLRMPTERSAVESLSDDDLMEAQRRLAVIDRRTGASAAVIAAEIAWRSRPDLGYAGLAQRTGARTPESLVQQLTGSTGREASTLVRVGKVMQEAELLPPAPSGAVQDDATDGASTRDGAGLTPEPWDGIGTVWLAPVGRAVAAGTLPVAAADAIRAGLGTPSGAITVELLAVAAGRLVVEAVGLNADALLKRARAVRDDIDAAGVVERERVRHEQRYLRVFKRHDGMVRVDGLLAPESGGAEVLATFEAITSPRRGGPRLVDKGEQERAQRILNDPRTTEQLQADALVELIRLGAAVDPGQLVGGKKPAVRVLTTVHELTTGTADNGATGAGAGSGIGRIEGHPDAISIDTVRRNICETGILPLLFDDDGQAVNVGRDLRLFTARQRIALAARDGGCRFPGCDRPPSWCEAHHIDQWWRDDGRTDLADGILLCRHHHMLVHNNSWRIKREAADYVLIPPRERDPQQTPIPMPSKSPALTDLYRRRRAG